MKSEFLQLSSATIGFPTDHFHNFIRRYSLLSHLVYLPSGLLRDGKSFQKLIDLLHVGMSVMVRIQTSFA